MVVNSEELLFILYPVLETPICSLHRIARLWKFSRSNENCSSDTYNSIPQRNVGEKEWSP